MFCSFQNRWCSDNLKKPHKNGNLGSCTTLGCSSHFFWGGRSCWRNKRWKRWIHLHGVFWPLNEEQAKTSFEISAVIHTMCRGYFHCSPQYEFSLMSFRTCTSPLVYMAVYNFTIWSGAERLLVKRHLSCKAQLTKENSFNMLTVF